VIEVVFNIPGMGLYLFDAINLRDYNAVMAVLVCASILTLFGIFLSDISYAWADPRISFDAQ
ncbi:MAG: ABC transporter permease subunit, partial [Myxococcota bacterium]